MEITFLLGSGISIPSKVSGVDQVTEKLLTGKWAIQNNKYIEVDDEDHRNDPRILSIQKLLLHIQERYSSDHHCLNYEELFYVAVSFKNYDLHPHENFIYKTEFNYFEEFFNRELKPDKWYDFEMVLNEIFKFFQSSISYLLQEHKEIKGFGLFEEIQEDPEVEICNLFTLNHDVILEKYFDEKGFDYNSGFNEKNGDVSLFNFDSLESNEGDFRLIKLHGSINWFSFSQEPGRIKQTRYGIPEAEKELHELKNSEGENYEPLFDYPHFLSGTRNKIIDYNNSTFFELRNYFFRKLEQSNNLIASGYGWRDEGIDQVIYNWLNKNKNNRIHFLYNNLKDDTGFRTLEFYKSRDQIVDYQVYLQSTEWTNIKQNLS